MNDYLTSVTEKEKHDYVLSYTISQYIFTPKQCVHMGVRLQKHLPLKIKKLIISINLVKK